MSRFRSSTFLAWSFFGAVAAFTWWRVSDNTADNDLWGHVLYGQRMLALGHLEHADPFSWTAPGARWINHEVLAEIALGWTHRVAGATGLWLLALGCAVVTLGLALREARRETRGPGSGLLIAGLLAASANGIALGFSARPQLFTMIALVLQLTWMQRLAAGQRWPWLTLPLLALVWINTHGGVLAGLVLLLVALAAAVTARLLPARLRERFAVEKPAPRVAGFFLAVLALCSVAAAFGGPDGFASLSWLIESVRYVRPEITEWRPTPLDFPYATFWIVAAGSVIAWLASRAPKRLWEAACLAALLAMAIQHQRHVPLFCLANLVLTPPHLLDVVRRLRPRLGGLIAPFGHPAVRAGSGMLLIAAGAAVLLASVRPPRVHPFAIEVERDQFPCAALAFLKTHPVEGNLLVFFDWGQQALWELPDNPVSFDGRLDTIYPRNVIEAHWKFYRGEPFDETALPVASASVALLRTGTGGIATLLARHWSLVYADPLATVLVRDPRALSWFSNRTHPVRNSLVAVTGREKFPPTPAARATGRN